jgi:NADP-dependent 3-hydroxy acid dehydrogenase YdfG
MKDRPLVMITGASSGIGAATATAFAEHGYPLLLVARRAEPMEALELPNALCESVDVTDRDAVAHAVARAQDSFGPVDLLVNNAGLMPLGQIHDQDPQQWERLFEVNCLAILRLSQLVLPGMMERKRGTIINVSSIAGRYTFANHTAYSGTKYAVHAMTESMRKEYAAHGIRLSVVAPGIVHTDLLSSTSDEAIVDSYVAHRSSIGGGLQASTVAQAMRSMYELPQEVNIRELVIAPTSQQS